MKKKVTALLLAAVLAMGMTACAGGGAGNSEKSSSSGGSGSSRQEDNSSGGNTAAELKALTTEEIKAAIKAEAEANGNSIQLKVWVPENESGSDDFVNCYKQRFNEFIELYGDTSYELKVGAAIKNMSLTPSDIIEKYDNAADVMIISASDLSVLKEKERIAEAELAYYGKGMDTFIDEAAASVRFDGTQYAYPVYYDSCFLVYDKNVYTDPADTASLDSLIAKAAENNKSFYYDIEDPWQGSAFLLTAGVPMTADEEKTTVGFETDEALSAYRSIADYGRYVGSGLKTYTTENEIGAKKAKSIDIGDEYAAYIAASCDLKGLSPDNIGVAKLPTARINGEQQQLETFGELFCLAIKKDTAFPKTAQALAAFLSEPEFLGRVRDEVTAFVPLREYENTEAIKAVKEQLPYMHSIRGKVNANYWGCGIGDFCAWLLQKNTELTDEMIREEIPKRIMPETGMKAS